MALSAVATPYALALLDLSTDRNELLVVRKQLDKVVQLTSESKELAMAFSNPTITVEERKAVVTSLATATSLTTTTRHFLLVLAEKGRLAVLSDIAETFGRLADERTGVARAEVVSSAPLDAGQEVRLKAKLRTLTGKDVELSNKVDASLIGGLRVHVGGQVFDTSVATQLRKLREAILQDI